MKNDNAFQCTLGYKTAKITIINLYIYTLLYIKIDSRRLTRHFFGLKIDTDAVGSFHLTKENSISKFRFKRLGEKYRATKKK